MKIQNDKNVEVWSDWQQEHSNPCTTQLQTHKKEGGVLEIHRASMPHFTIMQATNTNSVTRAKRIGLDWI